jgi:hypothetical protein
LGFITIIILQSKVVSLASNTQPRKPGLCIYVPQWQVGPVILPGTGFPFPRLPRISGLRWKYSNPPPQGVILFLLKLKVKKKFWEEIIEYIP